MGSIRSSGRLRRRGPLDDAVVADHATAGPLLAVWAHPDDESFLAAGALLEATGRGRPVVCAYATRGEHGLQHRVAATDGAGRRRERELVRALRILGVTDYRCLDARDGALAELPVEHGAARVDALVDEVAPTTVLTFGPDGVTGHPDHIAVHRWVVHSLARRPDPPALWQVAVTPDWVQRFAPPLAAYDVFWPGFPVAAPAHELTAHALAHAHLEAKVAALRTHASQTGHLFAELGERTVRAMTATEWYRMAAAPRPPAARPLARGRT